MTRRETIILSLILVLAATLLHVAHVLIFHDLHHVLIYLFGDIAFVPLEVLFVTLIVDRLLAGREAQARRHKMNMVIGVFFSDRGRPLLALLRPMLASDCTRLSHLKMQSTEADLKAMAQSIAQSPPELVARPEHLSPVRDLLRQHEPLLLQLLANPALLEHEEFTDVLWAVQHLQEELVARDDLNALPASDLAHLQGDLERACGRLLREWLQYLLHLKRQYPYLFSFEVRANPMTAEPEVEVQAS